MKVIVDSVGRLVILCDKLEKLYNGKAYVGLPIPDPDTGSRQHIDLALVAKGSLSTTFNFQVVLIF